LRELEAQATPGLTLLTGNIRRSQPSFGCHKEGVFKPPSAATGEEVRNFLRRHKEEVLNLFRQPQKKES
jgi:hypothetical protein